MVQLPCGQCIGCRLEKSRQWAVRCVHEASLYHSNCFVTLTYKDDEVVSLNKDDFPLFFRRLRKKFNGQDLVQNAQGKLVRPIRYFHCGEYGGRLGRPHHHACIFNFDFPDKRLWSEQKGVRLYRSEELERLWTDGYSLIGDVTYESAAYVARYTIKKVNGEKAKEHYTKVDETTGEVYEVAPEHVTMSRRPGIGANWYRKFKGDVYPKDYVTLKGRKHRSTLFYDRLLEKEQSELYNELKSKRKQAIADNPDSVSPKRRKAKETICQQRMRKLVRSL